MTMGFERSGISSSSATCSLSAASCRSKFTLYHVLCVFFLCFLLCAVTAAIVVPSPPSPHIRKYCPWKLATFYAEEEEGEGEGKRRILRGLGSWPPRCDGKCEKCIPCKPVHVPVPPSTTPIASEYYPEAWRCKCRDRLYIP